MELETPNSKDEAIAQAIEWQNWQSEQSLSYGELAEYSHHFERTGRKYGLLDEFRENGII